MTVQKGYIVLEAVLLLLFGFHSKTCATKYAGEFLSIGVGARPLGMGGAFVSVANDATSPYWNPAGSPRIDKKECIFMHSEIFEGLLKYDCLCFVYPHKKSAVGFNLMRLAVDDIPFITELEFYDYGLDGVDGTLDEGEGNGEWDPGEILIYDKDKIEWVSNNDYALLLNYGTEIKENLSVGVNLKVIRRNIGHYTAWGSGVDLGVLFTPFDFFTIGMNIQDVTTTFISWSTGRKEKITPTVKTGVSTVYNIASHHRLLFLVDQDLRFEYREKSSQLSYGIVSADYHWGVEYSYRGLVSLRLGINEQEPTAGAGIYYKGYSIDYAFLSHEELGSCHRISGGISF